MTEAFEGYLAGALAPDDEVLAAARAAAEAAGLPPEHVTGNQAALLALLARAIGARRILELGTLGGYSAIWLARALPDDGRLITVERDPTRAAVARSSIDAAGLADRVEVRVGPAEDEVARLAAAEEGPLDLAFIDVDEAVNATVFPAVRRLVRPGGLVAVGARDLVRGTRALLAAVAADPGVRGAGVQAVGSEGRHGFVLVHVTG